MATQGPGRHDRARARVRDHGDDHAAQHLPVAARRPGRLLRGLPVRGRVRPGRARPAGRGRAARADPRHRGGLPAAGRGRDGPAGRRARSGHRADRVDARRRGPAAQRALPARRAAPDRGGDRRGGGARAVRLGPRARAWRSDPGRDQRPAARAPAGRHRAVARVRARDVGARDHSRQPAVRGAVDAARDDRPGVPDGGCVQRRRVPARARGLDPGGARRGRPRARAVRWLPRDPAGQAALELVADQRARPAPHARAGDPGDLPRRRGVPGQRRGVAAGVPRADPDRGAQGARVRRPPDRAALPRAGVADRPDRGGAGDRGRREDRAVDDRSVHRLLSVPDPPPAHRAEPDRDHDRDRDRGRGRRRARGGPPDRGAAAGRGDAAAGAAHLPALAARAARPRPGDRAIDDDDRARDRAPAGAVRAVHARDRDGARHLPGRPVLVGLVRPADDRHLRARAPRGSDGRVLAGAAVAGGPRAGGPAGRGARRGSPDRPGADPGRHPLARHRDHGAAAPAGPPPAARWRDHPTRASRRPGWW